MNTNATPANVGSNDSVRPVSEAPECPACHGSGVIQTYDSSGLVDQFACDLCTDSEED